MPTVWICPDDAHLQAVFSLEPTLAARLLPCKIWDGSDGLFMAPARALTPRWASVAIAVGLKKAVLEIPGSFISATEVWHLFALKKNSGPLFTGNKPLSVLFACSSEEDAASIVANLLELGCDSFRTGLANWQEGDGQPAATPSSEVLVLTEKTPLYALFLALDNPRIRVLTADTQGIFVPAGWQHPLAQGWTVTGGRFLALRALRGWDWFDTGGLEPGSKQWHLLAGGDERVVPQPWARKIGIPLRLEQSTLPVAKPALWRIDSDLCERFLEWASRVPDSQLAHLEWISMGAGAARQFLVRPNLAAATTILPVYSAAYERAHPLEQIHIPVGTRLVPSLRQEKLREVTQMVPGQLSWFDTEPGADHSPVIIRHAMLSDFLPMELCVEYQLRHDTEALCAWEDAVEIVDLEEIIAEPPPQAPMTSSGESRQQEELESPEAKPLPETEKPKVKQARPVIVPAKKNARRNYTEAERAVLQAHEGLAALLDMPGPLHDPARLAHARDLATLFTAAGRPRDAVDALLFAHWSAPLPGESIPSGLVALERASLEAVAGPLATTILSDPWEIRGLDPNPPNVLGAATRWLMMDVATRADASPLPPRWVELLESVESRAPVRHVWLAWMNWRRLTGDVQSLARAHDRLLRRLGNGLQASRDSAEFLSTKMLTGYGSKSEAGLLLTSLLEGFKTNLTLRAGDPTDRLTRSLATGMFAVGAVLAGNPDLSASLWQEAQSSFESEGILGQVLCVAIQERLSKARAGEKCDSCLEVFKPESLGKLDAGVRFSLDQARKQLCFLEPNQSIDPFHHFLKSNPSHQNPLRNLIVAIQDSSPEQAAPAVQAGLNALNTWFATTTRGSDRRSGIEWQMSLQLLLTAQDRMYLVDPETATASLLLSEAFRNEIPADPEKGNPQSRSNQLALMRGMLRAAGPWHLGEGVSAAFLALVGDDLNPGIFQNLLQAGQGRLVGGFLVEMAGRLRAWDMESVGFDLLDALSGLLSDRHSEEHATLRLLLASQLVRRGRLDRVEDLLSRTRATVEQAAKSRAALRGLPLENRSDLARSLTQFALASGQADSTTMMNQVAGMLPSLLLASYAGASAQWHILKVVETLVIGLGAMVSSLDVANGWYEEEEACLRRVIHLQSRAAIQ